MCLYLDPGCPSFLGVMSHKFVGYTSKKVGHPGCPGIGFMNVRSIGQALHGPHRFLNPGFHCGWYPKAVPSKLNP